VDQQHQCSRRAVCAWPGVQRQSVAGNAHFLRLHHSKRVRELGCRTSFEQELEAQKRLQCTRCGCSARLFKQRPKAGRCGVAVRASSSRGLRQDAVGLKPRLCSSVGRSLRATWLACCAAAPCCLQRHTRAAGQQHRQVPPCARRGSPVTPQPRAAHTGTQERQGKYRAACGGHSGAACRVSRPTAVPASSRCSRSNTSQAASRTSNATASGILRSARSHCECVERARSGYPAVYDKNPASHLCSENSQPITG